MTVATRGNFVNRMLESLGLSERSRLRASSVRDRVRVTVRRELETRYAHITEGSFRSDARVETVVDTRVAEDTTFKAAIADEQWGTRLTTMYASVQLVEDSKEIKLLLGQQVEQQRQTNLLLRELLGALREFDVVLETERLEQSDGQR